MTKPSRAEMEAKLGTREPLPGGDKQRSPQMVPKAPKPAEDDAPAMNFRGLTNPKRVLQDREKAAGLKCGGKVKKMAGGGSVRGGGCATKGIGKGKVC